MSSISGYFKWSVLILIWHLPFNDFWWVLNRGMVRSPKLIQGLWRHWSSCSKWCSDRLHTTSFLLCTQHILHLKTISEHFRTSIPRSKNANDSFSSASLSISLLLTSLLIHQFLHKFIDSLDLWFQTAPSPNPDTSLPSKSLISSWTQYGISWSKHGDPWDALAYEKNPTNSLNATISDSCLIKVPTLNLQ